MNRQQKQLTLSVVLVCALIAAALLLLNGCARRCALDPTLERDQDLKDRIIGNSDACQTELNGEKMPVPACQGSYRPNDADKKPNAHYFTRPTPDEKPVEGH